MEGGVRDMGGKILTSSSPCQNPAHVYTEKPLWFMDVKSAFLKGESKNHPWLQDEIALSNIYINFKLSPKVTVLTKRSSYAAQHPLAKLSGSHYS